MSDLTPDEVVRRAIDLEPNRLDAQTRDHIAFRVMAELRRHAMVVEWGMMAVLSDEHGQRHVIDIADHGWTMWHPLSCWMSGRVPECEVNQAAYALGEPLGGRWICHMDGQGRLVLGTRLTG